MKKVISLLLAVVLALSLGVVVFADNGFQGNKNNLVASYSTEESYTVTIPSDQTISTTEQTGTVSATGVLLADGNKLVVTMASTNGYKMTYEGSEIAYTVSDGTETKFAGIAAQEVLVVKAGDTSGSTTLSFITTDDDIAGATKAGTHTDTLTFTCDVKSYLISFTISPEGRASELDRSDWGDFYAEEGMTFAQWVDSKYNTGNWTKLDAELVSTSYNFDDYEMCKQLCGSTSIAIDDPEFDSKPFLTKNWNTVITNGATYKVVDAFD